MSTISRDCQVLHGDIAQAQREITMAGFREGRFQVLVATDVAARGIDISGVDLIIQTQPPKDAETYVVVAALALLFPLCFRFTDIMRFLVVTFIVLVVPAVQARWAL